MTDPPRPADLPAGYDEEDPYADEDLSTYPDWWRRNIEEFRAHGMRPYRPPRFADDTLTPPVIDDLEAELDATVRLRSVNPQAGGDWEVVVDGDPVATVDRRREGEGFTRYAVDADEFEALVRDAVVAE